MAPVKVYVHKGLDALAVAELEESGIQQVQTFRKVALSPYRTGTNFSLSNINEKQFPLLPGTPKNHSSFPIDHHQSSNVGKAHGDPVLVHWAVFIVLAWLWFIGCMTALHDHAKRKEQRRCRLHKEQSHLARQGSAKMHWTRNAEAEVKRADQEVEVELFSLAVDNDDSV